MSDVTPYVPMIGLVLQFVILPIAGGLLRAVRGVRVEIEGVRQELAKMNGRLIRLEEWRIGHERQDDDRHRSLREEVRSHAART